MDSLNSLAKNKRLLCSFLKYDILNLAAAETNLYSEESGKELETLKKYKPVAAAERLLELIEVQSTYEIFVRTLERSIEIGHSQPKTVVNAQAHRLLVNELMAQGASHQNKPIGSLHCGNNSTFQTKVPVTTCTDIKEGLDHTNQEPGAGLQGHGLDPVLNDSVNDSKIIRRKSLDRSDSWDGVEPTVSGTWPRKFKSTRSTNKYKDSNRKVHHRKTFPFVNAHSIGANGAHRNVKDNNLERDISQAGSLLSIDSGIYTVRLSSTYKSSVADIPYLVGDDKEGVSRGVFREETATCQEPKDIKDLFNRFSDFESVILDQLQSFKKGIERLQQSQDELKKSVTAEMSQLRKQVKELKVTVIALKQSSLTKTPSKTHVSLDMQLDVETTATTSRSEESMETTSTTSEDNNDYTVQLTNSDTLAHEAKINQLCWIPFGIQTLTVGEEGGLFPLQPEGTKLDYEGHTIIMMEVAKNSVNTAVCDRLNIRYGVIPYGSFNIPNGYQLGSMVVYVYFEQEHATKPVVLHLPHWVGRDGEKNLKWVIAPHKLEEEEESYPFQFAAGEAFNDRYGAISIDGHCSLFGTVIDEEAFYKEGLRYYATGLERRFKEGANLCVMITYASQAWLRILEKYRGTTPDSNHVLFTFEDSTIKGTLSEKQGNGWRAWLNANDMVHREDVEYKSHGIRNAGDMEKAVKTAAYPPFISCQTTYSKEVRRTGVPTKVVLQIEGVKDKAMPFLCTAYEYRSEIERWRPIGHSDSLSPLPMYQTQTRSKYKLKVKDLMPYINDLKDSGLQIAGYLDLTTNWASIEKTNPYPADCLVALLNTWLNDTEVETCPHTWDYFIHIVRKLHKGKLADKMAKELSKIRHFQPAQASDTEV